MSENTRLDIDSNIPQEMDKIGKAVDATAKKIDKLGSGSALEELQRMMKSLEREFKSFGGTVDNAFDKALKNLSKSSMPDSVRDVYRNALILAKEGRRELESDYAKLAEASEKAAKRVAAAQVKVEQATAAGKPGIGAKKELATALGILASMEGKFSDARENAKSIKFFHLQLRDALNKEYNEFYLKRQATQKTANLQELQAFKDLGVKLQGEDAALYKRLVQNRKDFNEAVKSENKRAKAQSGLPYSEVSTGAVKNPVVYGPGKELFTQAKAVESVMTTAATKDQQFLNRYQNATKALESDNATRAKSLLDYSEVVRKAAEQSELLATKKFGQEAVQFSKSAEAQKLATKVAETEAAKLLKVQAESEAAQRKGNTRLEARAVAHSTSLAAKDQQFLNRYQNATKALESDNATRAKSLLDYSEVVRKAAEQSELLATKKFGQEAVQFSKSAEAQKLATKVAETEAAKLLKVEKEKSAAIGKPLAELAQKNQEFVNRYKNATSDFERGNKARAESLQQYLSVVKAVAEKSSEYATQKFGTTAVAMATGVEFDNLNKKLADTQSRLPSLLSGFKALGGRLIDVHSATRGLASGFNLLWLTWGQMGPLFAGAAISMGTKNIVTMGAQIGHQLEIIKVLSEESDVAVSGLNEQLMNIAKSGPYGPLQVAEALKTLSLAGLDATQAAQALPRVLQFAAAGTTSIEKAAEVMTGVATAFGYTAESFNLVGDIITKTAAVSKAGIEDMGEAFKAASVVSAQFGVSIKDVSLLLALQANLNIKNSAAGTNVRNLYTDLSGRSKEARKLMKELNLELTDSSGRFKDVVTLARELDGALSKFSGKAARDVQLQLLGERGGKAFVPVLTAYRTEVRELSVVNGQMVETVTNQLEQLKKKTEDNYGFMALAAAQLSMTPLKQMESVVSTFQVSLAQAFRGMEDEVIVTSARLKEVFNGPEFTSALKNLITGVAAFTEVLLENLDVVGKVILGYVGFKVLATTASLFIGLNNVVKVGTDYLAAYSAQQVKSSAVNAAAGVASNGVAIATASVGSNLLKAIPIIGTVVSVGTAAWSMWELYNLTQGKTADVTKAAADGIKKSGIIEALDSENERLLKQLAILDLSLKKKRQISEQEFDNMKKADEAAAGEAKRVAGAVAEARALEAKASAIRAAAAKTEEAYKKNLGMSYVRPPEIDFMYRQADEVDAARKKINTSAVKSEVEAKVERNRANAESVSDMTEQLNKTLRDLKVPGTEIFNPDAVNKSTKSLTSAIEKQISAVTKGGNAQLNEAKSNYDLEKDLLDARHKAGIVSEGAYQAELLKQTADGEAAQIKAIADTEAKLEPLYADALSKYKKGSAEYTALDEKREADFETLKARRIEITNSAYKREQTAAYEHQGKLIKLQQESGKYLADLSGERAKEASLAAVNRQYENVNESSVIWLQAEKAAATAAAEAVGKHEAQLRSMTLEYEKVAEAASALAEADRKLAAEGYVLPELSAAAGQMEEQRKVLETSIGEFRKQINQDVANQSAIAYNEAFRKRANEFKNTVAQTLADALISGANDGGKNLRKILENELKAPFVLLFRMSIDALMGDLGKAAGSAGGTGSSGFSDALSSLSAASTLNTAYKALSGAMAGSIGKSFEKFATSSFGEALGLSTKASMYSSGANLSSMGGGTGLTAGGSTGLQATGTTGLQASAAEASSSLTTLGSTVKQVGVSMAAAFAGQALRKGISGGYSVGGTGETVMDVAALIAGFDPTGIASFITGAVSGLINRAFGLKLKDTGIQGTFSGSEFKGENYQYLKGGLFRSSKTKTSAMDSEAVNTFTNTFRSIQASTAVLATNMGISAQSALDFKKDIKLSLKDLDPAAQSEAITKMFTDVQEEMATAVLDAWGDWSVIAKYGETASEVLTNVSNNLTGLNGVLKLLGISLIETTVYGAASASALAEAFGGTDNLTQSLSSYYEAFYTESERTAKQTKQVTETLANLGFQLPLTRDAYRNLVDSQSLVTAEGRSTFKALIDLSSAFDAITPKVEDLAEKLKEAMTTAVEAVSTALSEQVSKSEDAASKARDSANDYFDMVKTLATVKKELQATTYTVEGSLQVLASQFRATAAKAATGDLTAMGALGESASSYAEAILKSSSSRVDYARQVAAIQKQISATQAVAEVLGTGANYQAKLFDLNTAMLQALESELEKTDKNLETLQAINQGLVKLGETIGASSSLAVQTTRETSGALSATLVNANGAVVANLTRGTALTLQGLQEQTTSAASQLSLNTSSLVAASAQQSAAQVSAIDTNRDGLISTMEMQFANSVKSDQALLSLLNASVGNGASLTAAQIRTSLAGKASDSAISSLISTVDTNLDGVVSASEIQSAYQVAAITSASLAQVKTLVGQTASINSASGASLAKVSAAVSESAARQIAAVDLNNDGIISTLELGYASYLSSQSSLLHTLISAVGNGAAMTSAQIRSSLAGKASDSAISALISAVDSNLDGVVSSAELQAANTRATLDKTSWDRINATWATTEALAKRSASDTSWLSGQIGSSVWGSANSQNQTAYAVNGTQLAATEALANRSASDTSWLSGQIGSSVWGSANSQNQTAYAVNGSQLAATNALGQTVSKSSSTQAEVLGLKFNNSILGQTASFGGFTSAQLSELKGIDASQSQVVDLSKQISDYTGGNATLTEALLRAFSAKDEGSSSIVKAIKDGNISVTSSLSALVGLMSKQIAEAARKESLANAEKALAEAAAKQQNMVASVNQGISGIWDLAKQFGVYLNSSSGGFQASNSASFAVNSQGLFESKYGQISDPSGTSAAFKKAFYSAGGAYDQTYGQAKALSDAAKAIEQARELVKSLGGVPQFAKGGYTGSGAVNELAGLVHKGEVVWSQSDIANAGGLSTVEAMRAGYMPYAQAIPAPAMTYTGAQGTISFDESALLEELQAMREELSNMRYEVRVTAVNTGKAAKHLKEFDDRGLKVKNAETGALEVTTV